MVVEAGELLRVPEVAAIFRVHRSTVYRLIDEGYLGAVRVGPRTLRVPRDEVERLLRDRAAEARRDPVSHLSWTRSSRPPTMVSG